MRIIKYLPKVTNARTTYVDIDVQDMYWLQSELIRYLSLMGEIDGHRNEDLRQIMKYWWYKRTKLLPKSTHGQNSPLTFVSGLVNNLMFGTQYNLTTHVLDGIEYVSQQIHLLEDAISDLNTIKTTRGERIKFVQSWFQIQLPTH